MPLAQSNRHETRNSSRLKKTNIVPCGLKRKPHASGKWQVREEKPIQKCRRQSEKFCQKQLRFIICAERGPWKSNSTTSSLKFCILGSFANQLEADLRLQVGVGHISKAHRQRTVTEKERNRSKHTILFENLNEKPAKRRLKSCSPF